MGPVGYTLANVVTEPHPPNIKITSDRYAKEMINTTNSQDNSLLHLSSSLDTLFFHNFSVDGSRATFWFSLHYYSLSFHGNFASFAILISKANQSIGFPYYGAFMLEVASTNVTTEINVNGTEIYNPGYVYPGEYQSLNSSLAVSYLGYAPNVAFTTTNQTIANSNGIKYASNYSLTYRLEVTPVVEFGPYYVTGQTQWISHTIQYPYVNGSSS